MLEDLKLASGLSTLEVGAGTGYNAALLAHLVGPGLVTSVDVDRNVLSEAWDHLRAFCERGIDLKHADGRAGYADKAPYDRIMVTAATPDLELKLAGEQTPRGWGLFLIKNMVDEMNVSSDDTHHTIELVMNLGAGAPESPGGEDGI